MLVAGDLSATRNGVSMYGTELMAFKIKGQDRDRINAIGAKTKVDLGITSGTWRQAEIVEFILQFVDEHPDEWNRFIDERRIA